MCGGVADFLRVRTIFPAVPQPQNRRHRLPRPNYRHGMRKYIRDLARRMQLPPTHRLPSRCTFRPTVCEECIVPSNREELEELREWEEKKKERADIARAYR